MAETLEEVTYDYEEEGRLVRRELKREVLSKGAWATLMAVFLSMNPYSFSVRNDLCKGMSSGER